jgi:hypothetical protein
MGKSTENNLSYSAEVMSSGVYRLGQQNRAWFKTACGLFSSWPKEYNIGTEFCSERHINVVTQTITRF